MDICCMSIDYKLYTCREDILPPPRFSRTGREAGTNYGAAVNFAAAASRRVFAYKKCVQKRRGGNSKETMVAGGEPARRRLGRATVAELLRLRHHSRRDSERADQARSESLRNLLASTNRSPAIGLRSCSSGTVRQPLHLSPIAGERLVLVQWLREDSRRAC